MSTSKTAQAWNWPFPFTLCLNLHLDVPTVNWLDLWPKLPQSGNVKLALQSVLLVSINF